MHDTAGNIFCSHGIIITKPLWTHRATGETVGVVKLPGTRRGFGFVLLPRRREVERTLVWLSRFHRLIRDYERLPETLKGLHFLAIASLMPF